MAAFRCPTALSYATGRSYTTVLQKNRLSTFRGLIQRLDDADDLHHLIRLHHGIFPGAQRLRDMEFSYGFCSFSGTPYKKGLSRLSDSFAVPVLVARNTAHPGVSFCMAAPYEDAVSPLLPDGSPEVKTALVWLEEPVLRDFSPWKIPACVTREEIGREEQRADELELSYQRKLAAVKEEKCALLLKGNSSPAEKEQASISVMKAHALHRSALEARLSAIFAEEALMRMDAVGNPDSFLKYQKSIEPRLRELAYRLNLARIDKRVSEYITDYFTHRREMAEHSKQDPVQ